MNRLPQENRQLRNFAAFTVLLAILACVHFIIAADPTATKSAAQAAVFQWWFLGLVAGGGGFGAFFLNLTTLRGMWDGDLTTWAKTGAPFAAGAALGIAYILGDTMTGFSHMVAAKMHLATIHIAWPLAVPIYFGGAILVSILYFLVLLPPVNWLVAIVMLKGRSETIVYWLTALPFALVEPLTQGDVSSVQELGWTAVPNLVGDVALGITQAWYLRRTGFIGCVAVRIGFYAIWHVAFPLL